MDSHNNQPVTVGKNGVEKGEAARPSGMGRFIVLVTGRVLYEIIIN
jgi:hypothetical protein